MVLAIGTMSCDRHPKTQLTGIAAADFAVLNEGKLSFYDIDSKTLIPFAAETDSVINMAFFTTDHLYYTVSENRNLKLKMVDLSENEPQPQFCADWMMTLDENIDFMTGGVSGLYFDNALTKIIIPAQADPEYFSYTGAKQYDPKTGEVATMSIDEYYETRFYDNQLDYANFYSEDKNFYYVDKNGRHCLNDRLDFAAVFLEDELSDMEFYPLHFNHDTTMVSFSAVIPLGEGWGKYCVSTIDGSNQFILPGSDIWDPNPGWLSDGSVVYVNQDVVHVLKDGTVDDVVSPAHTFAVRPCNTGNVVADVELPVVGSDLVILDKGKMIFYNSLTNDMVPYPYENDSVVNGVFGPEGDLFYTVCIGDDLYLKSLYIDGFYAQPRMRTGWDLKLDDCVSETYGRVSPLNFIASRYLIGIEYNFSWDYYGFSDVRFFDYSTWKKHDGWNEDDDFDEYGIAETDDYDEAFLKYLEDLEHFVGRDHNYYYMEDGREICLTDKINFMEYVSDPAYAEEPEFDLIAVDPTRRNALFGSILEYGDLAHGPLVVASLDGKMQVVLGNTDVADYQASWLQDGSLVYVEGNVIKRVSPDGTISLFYEASDFFAK